MAAWISTQLKTPPSLLQLIPVSNDMQNFQASTSPGRGYVDRDFITYRVDVIRILLDGILECHPTECHPSSTLGSDCRPGALPLSRAIFVGSAYGLTISKTGHGSGQPGRF